MMRLVAAFLLVFGASEGAYSETVDCDKTSSVPPYAFKLSKPDMVAEGDLTTFPDPDREGLSVLKTIVGPETAVEESDGKRSQRSEVRETGDSAASNGAGGWQCYRFAFRVPAGSALPTDFGPGKSSVLSVAQFHIDLADGEKMTGPIAMFRLDGAGHLSLVLNEALGRRQEFLLIGGDVMPGPALGRWMEILVVALWSEEHDGRLHVLSRDTPSDAYRELASYRGRTAVPGTIYQKLGAYRSFLERDPEYAEQPTEIHYRGIFRGRDTAAFRLSE